MSRRLQRVRRDPIPAVPNAKRFKEAVPTAPTWPSYTGQSQYVGSSTDGRVDVFVDPTLGPQAVQNAQDLVNDADRVGSLNDAFFGIPGGDVQVIVFALGGATDGSGGADHMGCDFTVGAQIEVCASFGASMRVSALFEAELSECSMSNNLCGESTGEALSRWCASNVSNNALADFATAPTWYGSGMANWVDNLDPTDQNADSTGCGMAFISWLQSLGYTLSQIAQGMVALGDGGLFCVLYGNLTGDDPANAWSKFQAAIAALPFGVTDDDPFAGTVAPPAPAPSPPAPTPSPPTPPTSCGMTLNDGIRLVARHVARELASEIAKMKPTS
jgi:hypothetical protein